MATKKLATYLGETYKSLDPRDEGRQIRIADVVDDRLRYRTMIESTVSPGTLVPNGRKGLITPATLRKSYEKVA